MRHTILVPIALVMFGLSACAQSEEEQVQEVLDDINVIDETNLNDVMLTVANADEAVRYFANANASQPGRLDLQRGLASSLIRAGRAPEGITAWQTVVANEESDNGDKVELAGAYVRANQWDNAAATLNTIPPTFETFNRYRLEAMVADSRQQWTKADSFYETAVGLTTRPASVYNNWGFSKLTRGEYADAERLFVDALRFDSTLFTAKNNMVLARGAQRNYALPVVPMTQIERAQLLHTMALTAIKQNDVTIGKSLLVDAIDTHPQFFEEASRALEALENGATN